MAGSGRVRSYHFCSNCGFASEEALNACPACATAMEESAEVAFIEAFEAEQNTEISSSEEARERAYFERRESLLVKADASVEIHPYGYTDLEFIRQADLLVTNWGKRAAGATGGEQFQLCGTCGRHKPRSLTRAQAERWDTNHAGLCNGSTGHYVLGYRFQADTLVMPLVPAIVPSNQLEAYCRTLGSALILGAVELLEIEPDEVAFFHHTTGRGGAEIVFYETAPGGAGYLPDLAENLGLWAKAAEERLFDHDCGGACYKCLKSYRNQPKRCEEQTWKAYQSRLG